MRSKCQRMALLRQQRTQVRRHSAQWNRFDRTRGRDANSGGGHLQEHIAKHFHESATHLAIVEVWWMLVAQERANHEEVLEALGVDGDADGMPLKPSARAPKALAKQTLKDYEKLMAKARAFVTKGAKKFKDTDMDRLIERTRWDGRKQKVSPRWILYHVLEHFSGHYGQILLIRHLYKDSRRGR